ncbi:MAG: signal transduction protein, partial [Moorea sp. SIO3I7]|nr:signal transduction protein [Moorena sp. SIO3I7]
RKNYFFRQTEVEQYIADYICNLPDAKTDPEALQLDSEAVLKSIEAQHGLLVERARGIYSFSHLTFQEYFTARKIVTTSNPEVLEQAMQNLATHITEVRWREVFLLALGILPSADSLLQLMKQQVDKLVARSHNLQKFLKSVNRRAILIQGSYKPVVMRAFFLANELSIDQDLSFLLCKEFQLNEDFDIDRLLNHVLNRAFDRTLNRVLLTTDIDIETDLTLFLNRALNLNLEPKLKQLLQQLKAQMPDITETKDIWNQWWRTQGSAWATQLKAVMNQYSIGQTWVFTKQQEKVLKQYYNANLFLLECLNSDFYVSLEVRKRIQDTLLLPMVEIKKYK